MKKQLPTFGITLLIFIIGLSGCTETKNAVDIKIINSRNSEVIITNITLDDDELENFTIPSNSTYNITGLDPDKYPQGQSHSLKVAYEVDGQTYSDEPRTFEYLCYIEILEDGIVRCRVN